MRKDILERLVALRKKAGLTAHDVSLQLGRTRYYISRMENGVFFPPFHELDQILGIYNSSMEELFYKEFDEFRFETDMMEKFRCLGKQGKDAVLMILFLAYENLEKEKKNKKKII